MGREFTSVARSRESRVVLQIGWLDVRGRGTMQRWERLRDGNEEPRRAAYIQ